MQDIEADMGRKDIMPEQQRFIDGYLKRLQAYHCLRRADGRTELLHFGKALCGYHAALWRVSLHGGKVELDLCFSGRTGSADRELHLYPAVRARTMYFSKVGLCFS